MASWDLFVGLFIIDDVNHIWVSKTLKVELIFTSGKMIPKCLFQSKNSALPAPVRLFGGYTDARHVYQTRCEMKRALWLNFKNFGVCLCRTLAVSNQNGRLPVRFWRSLLLKNLVGLVTRDNPTLLPCDLRGGIFKNSEGLCLCRASGNDPKILTSDQNDWISNSFLAWFWVFWWVYQDRHAYLISCSSVKQTVAGESSNRGYILLSCEQQYQ